MERLTFTPPEFAAVFGKERTWAYRQLYAGKVQAITELGRTLIPKSEVDRLLKEAGRYLGAGAKVKKTKASDDKTKKSIQLSAKANGWAEAIIQRKRRGSPTPRNGKTSKGQKPAVLAASATSRQAVYQRLARSRTVRKDTSKPGG